MTTPSTGMFWGSMVQFFNTETFLHSLYTKSKSPQTDYSSQLISYQWSAVIDDYAVLFSEPQQVIPLLSFQN